ncbi:MAG: hypothetical protein HXY26_09840 [Hydrogenophilaceae bacterium]|nr:hypothetical protein [Hydrogenophilaceae bacterium]
MCGFGVSAARAGDAWADFRSDLIALHEKLTEGKPLRVEQGEVLSFKGEAAKGFSYQDLDYYDPASGRLISHIRRSPGWPYRHYEVEVYIHDAAGRVIRDYAALTLPWQLERPVRTYINLHDYPGELHAFRQFDGSGEIDYESCVGRLNGQKIKMQLESIDVGPKLRATPEYQACFGRLPMQPGPYLKPH